MLVMSAMILAIFFASSELSAGVMLPSDLSPGASYRIAFVTSGVRGAESPHIEAYNNFVSDQAASSPDLAALNTGWRAIVNAAEYVLARDNTFTQDSDLSAPIYNTHGELIATSNTDFWDNSLLSPISYDELGLLIGDVYVATGTDGYGHFEHAGAVGDQVNFPPYYVVGDPHRVVEGLYFNYTIGLAGELFSFYAISGVLTVPNAAAAPELTSFATFGGLAMVCGLGYRRNRR